jgi:hypothetical protein
MMGKKKTARLRGGGMSPKKKIAKKNMGGMMSPKKKMAKGGSAEKKIAETKIGLHKLDAMGMLGKSKATFNKARARKPSGRLNVDDIKRATKTKKQGYKDRKDESIAERSPKKELKNNYVIVQMNLMVNLVRALAKALLTNVVAELLDVVWVKLNN